jgi:hypothetical protein
MVGDDVRCLRGYLDDRLANYVYAKKFGQPNNLFGQIALPGGISMPATDFGVGIRGALGAKLVTSRQEN